MKEQPHNIMNIEEIEKALKSDQKIEDVAVRIPPEELAEVKFMNRRARKRWLKREGVTVTEFRSSLTDVN